MSGTPVGAPPVPSPGERDPAAPEPGLSAREAARLLVEVGPNSLPEIATEGFWRRLWRQFESPLVLMLVVAVTLDLVVWATESTHGVPIEAISIGLILTLNAALGVLQENRSERALARLRELSAPRTWTLRDGRWVELESRSLVPGDCIRLEAGERVPADAVLVRSESLLVDEAVLTGESLPVEKQARDELFSGTLAQRGRAYATVSRTGAGSAMGRLAGLLSGITAAETPLEARMRAFGKQVAIGVLGLAAVLTVAGLLVEGVQHAVQTLLFAVALAVAAVPEGLPAVLTLALAMGVERMAQRHALVRRLAAVEALGSVTVIATDKTGTLTENRMRVRELDSPEPELAMRVMVLANDGELSGGAGDPLDLALLDHAREQGVDARRLRAENPRLSARPFDSTHRFMRATAGADGSSASYLKGAPEVVLARSTLSPMERRTWEEKVEASAAQGHRVVALASGAGETEEDLRFLGLVALWDPPRPEVADAIRRARGAGIRVLMITGDHPATARAVGQAVGIGGDTVLTHADVAAMSADRLREAVRGTNLFARFSPEDKLRLVEALQADGEIVAVTGDGVNDAPALKRSDVGVSMGLRGTDVAREVSDLVLLDDNFATIVAAVEEGRGIFRNIQKFTRFLFSTNLAEVLVVSLGWGMAWALGVHDEAGAVLLPLTAVQMLWINLVTDGLPALALSLDRNPGVLASPPRDPRAPLLDRPTRFYVLSSGALCSLFGFAFLGLTPQIGHSLAQARTALFVYLAAVQLFLAYTARTLEDRPPRNLAMHAALVLGLGLIAMTLAWAPVRRMFGVVSLPLWLYAAIAGAIFLTVWGTAAIGRRLWTPPPPETGRT